MKSYTLKDLIDMITQQLNAAHDDLEAVNKRIHYSDNVDHRDEDERSSCYEQIQKYDLALEVLCDLAEDARRAA